MAAKNSKGSGPARFNVVVKHMVKVERLLDKGEYVEASDLIAALRDTAGKPIPEEVLEYLCEFLDGNVSKPAGRPSLPPNVEFWRRVKMRFIYYRYLHWLQARKKRYGHLDGWSALRSNSDKWWQGPPHERAKRIVAVRCGYRAESWEHVADLISSVKP